MAKPKSLRRCASTIIKVYEGSVIGRVISIVDHHQERIFTAQAEEGCVDAGTLVVFCARHCCSWQEVLLNDKVLLIGIGSNFHGKHFSFEVHKIGAQ